MLNKIKNIDPMTKSLIVATAALLTVNVPVIILNLKRRTPAN